MYVSVQTTYPDSILLNVYIGVLLKKTSDAYFLLLIFLSMDFIP